MSSSPAAPIYSVLILGSTQAGKSTLIEHIRNYADPDYTIDESLLGNGIVSKTDSTTPILINSNLPVYEAYRKDTGAIFDLKNLASKYEDEEDYRDILLSHPDDVDIRLAPHGPNAPSQSMKFRFLDTPGLNGTQGRDSEHAANIVNEIIGTQSFNLFVFVISSKNPLTEEKQLALEYFAYVLRGLHSRIVFLYTHVNYSDTHCTNETHHLDMEMKYTTLGTIFRRHDGESEFDKNNITQYPSLAIDLVTQNRPIVQCLIRNTIREILTMATASPAVLDVSTRNIERIRAITYPTEFGQEQGKTFESELRRGQVNGKYSVLVLGKTQAGKSALIEHIKHYADPEYSIDQSLLGSGNFSMTNISRPFYIRSKLTEYEVFRKNTGEIIDLHDLPNRYSEDDFHDILFSREEDVGLRQASHDPHSSSELVEIRFLDTPGLNGTQSRDEEHAANIISEMAITRSFNLIIIVVSYKQWLNFEQQDALEYYANAFKGLHSRIMFLHTNVDYSDIHHTNNIHHVNMKIKNMALSKIFRRLDSEVLFDEDNFKEYPSLTIDLISKKRPVIDGLIKNTICKILQMATQSHITMDTSLLNIGRIQGIIYPNKLFEERHKMRAFFQAKEQVDIGGKDLEKINILIIGDVQSGKTSLVETFKFYADPAYKFETEHVTRNSGRFADEKVMITAFLSDIHTFQIWKLREDIDEFDMIGLKEDIHNFDVVDLEHEAKRLSEKDFTNLLNLDPERVMTTIIPSNGGKKYQFNIFEGPSLSENAENFEKHIFNIHRTLIESEQKFHQVLFTLSPGTITDTIRTTIQIFFDIFPDLSPYLSFVHTRIDYFKLHTGNKQFQDSMKKREEQLQLSIQSFADSYMIDCDLQSKWPIQRAMTYNVVHDILKSAISQTPVALMSPLMKKTPRMVLVDANLKWQARVAFQDTQKEIAQNNKDLFELHSKICQLNIDYKAKDQVVNGAKSKEDVAPHDDMEPIFEEKRSIEPFPRTYSPTMVFKEQPRTIEKVELVCTNIEIEKTFGGQGFNHWRIIYRRKGFAAASLVVKLYAKKQASNSFDETNDMAAIRHQREEFEIKLRIVQDRLRNLRKLQEEYNMLRYWIFCKGLPKFVLESSIKAEVYKATNASSPDAMADIYQNSRLDLSEDPYASNDDSVPEGSRFDVNSEYFKHPVLSEASGDEAHQLSRSIRPKKYSVLIFGKTQAGKSTFVEFVKKYANLEHKIDMSLIGNGLKSTTGYPIRHVITSSLPAYDVFDCSEEKIDIHTLGNKYGDPGDYLDALNDRKASLRAVPQDPDVLPPGNVEITFLDTPGIEDTEGRDTEHAPKIIEEMAKMRTFNLIVIIVNCKETPSKSHQLAFDYYSKVIQVLQGCHSNIVFVCTHVDYVHCHHSNVTHQTNMEMRRKAFSRLFRGQGHRSGQGSFNHDAIRDEKVDLYPWYTVDLKEKHRPIPQCMLLDTLREILQRVVTSPPVPLDTIVKNLIRVYGISHPDELNRLQRNKIMTPMCAILEEKQPESNDTSAVNASKGGVGGGASDGADEDGYLSDHFCGRADEVEDDCADYFSNEDGNQKHIDDSEDELEG